MINTSPLISIGNRLLGESLGGGAQLSLIVFILRHGWLLLIADFVIDMSFPLCPRGRELAGIARRA